VIKIQKIIQKIRNAEFISKLISALIFLYLPKLDITIEINIS
jgi:hypothetical protein